ncbi:MAG: acetyl-CoA hydrolase/transferase family protein [Chloroflexi bacterium]|nr:acetyl-CoA hydrolase/transferase family protein [Chloroflexota bacterium]
MRIVSPEKAIGIVTSGETVVLGTGCAEPQSLVDELVRQRERLSDVRLLTMTPAGKCAYAGSGMERHFRVLTFLGSPGLYDAIRAGRADYIPCHLSEIPRLFTQGYVRVDAALIQVSPPDAGGYCSLGISVDYLKVAVREAKVVVAEINERMPRTRGDCYVHMSEIDLAIESSQPLLTVERAAVLSEEEQMIGRNVADLVTDGATVQVGIGGLPDAVLRSLRDKRDLRIHTGIISDGIIDLVQAGAIASVGTGRSPVVSMLAMGSHTLYSYLHENPTIEMHPCTFTHASRVISQIEDFVSVNSALQVDPTGQVNAEYVGGVQVSGVGGQADFIRGAALAPGGRSIIALPSTANGGKVSRLVAKLDPGAVVTTPRTDVHYVVTEYGVADLRGKSLKERARALAAIAHPRFRDELLEASSV